MSGRGAERCEREARGRGNSSSRRGRAAQLPPEGGKTGTILGIKLTSDSRVVGSAHANHRLGVARLAIGRLMSAGLNGLHHEPQAISTIIHAYVHPAAAYGGELLLGAERHTLDTAWEGALGAAMGRDVGSGPRRLPPSYARCCCCCCISNLRPLTECSLVVVFRVRVLRLMSTPASP